MTEKDVDGVCSHLKNIPHGLPYGMFIPPVYRKFYSKNPQTGDTQLDVVASIRAWLGSTQNPRQRLILVAQLYSWLASLDVLKPWTLYRLNASVKRGGHVAFFDKLSKGMRSDGFAYTCGFTETAASMCCSILMSDDGSMTMEHRLVCFNLWFERPFLAVHDAGALVAHAKRLQSGLAAVHVDTEQCLHGYYEKLTSAHAEVSKNSVGK
ncbi:hypothetical protein MTO96_010728 [Rhipicephalus appendiculatus]